VTERSGGVTNPPEMARAEELVDQLGETIGGWASQLSLEFLRAVARAREEAEDIWAEARYMAQGDRS
jgi:hypothetical protein